MTVAAYDNPDTMQREAWQNGKLVASVSASQLCAKDFNGHPNLFFGLNVGPWSPGQLVGDREALCTCTPVCSSACKGQCGCQACRDSWADFLSNE